jgi:hypothetical protein
MIGFYIQEHMKEYFTDDVRRIINFVERQARNFSRALLCDIGIQSVRASAQAAASYSFGLHVAQTTAANGPAKFKFSPKDVLVVQEAWRNIFREVMAESSVEDIEDLMVEMAQRLSYLKKVLKSQDIFMPEFAEFLPAFDEKWSFENIV